MNHAAPVVEVLYGHRQIELVLMPQRANVSRGCAVTQHHLDRVARHQMDEQEHQRYHQPDYRQRQQEACEGLLHGLNPLQQTRQPTVNRGQRCVSHRAFSRRPYCPA